MLEEAVKARLQLGCHLLGDAVGAARALCLGALPPAIQIVLARGSPCTHGDSVDQILKALRERSADSVVPVESLDQRGNFPPIDLSVAGH